MEHSRGCDNVWPGARTTAISITHLFPPFYIIVIIVGLISRRVVSFHLLVVRRVSGADDAETRMLHPVPWSRSLSVVLVSKAQHNFSFEDHRTEMLDLSRTLH